MTPLDILFAKEDRLFKPPKFDPAQLPPGFAPSKAHLALLQHGNGGYYWGGLLHVFGACAEPNFHSLKEWNDETAWRKPYGAAAEGLVFFAETAFGDQFALDDKGAVYLFKAAEGIAELCAENFDQWLSVIVDEEVWDAFGLYKDQLSRFSRAMTKRLEHGMHLQAYPPFDFVEDRDHCELSEVEAYENMVFHADLARAIADLPPGMRLVFGPDGIEQVPAEPDSAAG